MIVGKDIPLDTFGGLVTDEDPADLQPGCSPDCQDVRFSRGAVRSRPGLKKQYVAIAGNPTVNYLKSYTQPDLTTYPLALDSAGKLWKEAAGVLSQISGAGQIRSGCFGKSATLFGREYIGLSDGKFGFDIPFRYNGTSFRRVSRAGPAKGPSAADAAAGAAKNIVSIARTSNIVELVISNTDYQASGIHSGSNITVAGVTDATFDGTFTVGEIVIVHIGVSVTAHIYYSQVAADSTDATGTVQAAGSVTAGLHQVVVMFVTDSGYITAPSPPITWNAAGANRVAVTNIPLASSGVDVVAKIIAFTAKDGADFFYTTGTNGTPNMVVSPITTSATFDFADATLLSGTPVASLFDLIQLGEVAGFIGYSERLFAWGERNQIRKFLNLDFDGGWSTAGTDTPHGWTLDATSGAGSTRGFSPIWGGEYQSLGDGATATRGLLYQSAVTDSYGVPILAANVSYSIRARVRKVDSSLLAGRLNIDLQSTTGSIDTTGLQVSWNDSNISTDYREFTAILTSGLASIPSDLLLRLFVDQTPTLATGFAVDNIEIYPTDTPYLNSTVRASRASDPESYDGVTGFLQVAESNGQAVRSAFVLRDQLYFVKEHSLHMTQNDGVNEPSSWTVSEVSRTVGSPSINGADLGEDWAAIASRAGLYIFTGSEPIKVSQEIQPTWDRINWQYGYSLWVRVDTLNKRVLVGVPLDAATTPSHILVLDYRDLASGFQIIAAPAGTGRKWAIWNIAANSADMIERTDGTAQFWLGNGVGTGLIHKLDDDQLSDEGVSSNTAINAYYTTHFWGAEDGNQRRKLFSYLRLAAEGSGTLNLFAYRNDLSVIVTLPTRTLVSPTLKDLELMLNVIGERVAFRFGTNGEDEWFNMRKFIPTLSPHPWSPVRGN